MPPLTDDTFATLEKWRTHNDIADSAVNGDTGLSQRLGDMYGKFWWIHPDAVWSLAKAGLPTDHPAVQTAAQAAAHLEVNQGLSFQPIGAPVHAPSSPPDVTSILNSLDRKQQPPAPDPTRYAAPSQGPLRQAFTDEHWNELNPDVQKALNSLQLEEAQAGDPIKREYELGGTPPNAHDAAILQKMTDAADQKTYRMVGWDNVAPNLKPAVAAELAQALGGGVIAGARGGKLALPGDAAVYADAGYVSTASAIVAQKWADATTPSSVLDPLAPIIRPAFMITAAPFQELQGGFRDVYQLATGGGNPGLQSQSDLGIAIGDLLHGRKVDTGTGLFLDPNSQVAQERQRRILTHGNIAGHGITIGRALANTVFEPGSKPYSLLSGLVDAGVALKYDPAVKAMKFGSEIRAGSKLIAAESSTGAAMRVFHETGQVTPALQAFQEAGGLAGLRPAISKDAANYWLDSPKQAPMLDALAQETNPYKIWRALGRKADPEVAAALADASTPQDVANVLRDQLGSTIRDKFTAGDVLTAKTSAPSRWMAMMPDRAVDSTSSMANAVELERAASLTKAPAEQLHTWFDRMARATNPSERLGVWEQAMNDTAERLVGKGVPLQRAKQLTRLAGEQEAVDRVYAVRAVGDGKGTIANQTIVDGKQAFVADNQPTMLAQTLDSSIPLPDWRALRKSLSAARPVLENQNVLGAEYLLNRAQGTVWKALQISTVKTMIKVLGDEQLAIAGRGYDSLINHPLSALSVILATPLSELPEDAGFIARLQHATAKTLRSTVEQIPGVEPRLTSTALGHEFDTLHEVQTVASHGFDTATDKLGVLHADDWKVLERVPGVNDAEFLQAHARHLAQYAASPETRGFARLGSLQEAQNAYWDGELAPFRERLATVGRTGRPELLTREGSDAYVAKTMRQMQVVTNGNPDLMDAIANGKLGDSAVWSVGRDGTPQVSKNFVNKLAGYSEDFPLATPQQKAIYSADAARRQVADGIFGRAIHTLLGTPSAVLSKSPLFRQAYWERIIDNAPLMTPEAQQEVVRAVEGANLGKKLMGELSDAVTRSEGVLSLEQADTIAKSHGLDIVRRTTHEFSQRSQAFDMLRLLTPFGEVWRKTIQRWANIVNENPQVVRRLQQGLDAAHGQDLGAFFGAPAGQGFFHTDQNGQEVFTVPGSEWATQALTGVPVPLVGNVKGLSLGTEFFPALGPVASIPVAYTLEKLNAMNVDLGPLGTLGETLFPYGPPQNFGDVWNYAPSWMKNAFGANRPTSPDSVRTFNNSIIDYIRYGLTNGDYDTSTPEGIQHAIEDATNKANVLYKIRGAVQFFVPGAPSPQMLVRDKTGKLMDAGLLVQEFKKLQDADPNTAGQKFLDQFGPDVFKSMTSKSYAYVFGIPTSRDAQDWVDQHPTLQRDLPHIFGYFAPPSDPNQFDYEVYRSQLEPGGGRTPLSPEQWTKLGNARLAALQYGALRDRIEAASGGKLNDALRAMLAQRKQQLMDQYPGYADSLYGGSGLPERPDPKLLVREAEKAVDDPTVKNTDAGKGLAAYLKVRDTIDQAWVASGYSSGSWATSAGASALALRGLLRTTGEAQTTAHPQFGPLFEDVFLREMRDDTNPNDFVSGGG